MKEIEFFQENLNKIVPYVSIHAKFLNTLSYMEHIGSYKILSTQHNEFINEMILKHAAEEARHGYYLKKLSQKILPNENPNYTRNYLLAPIVSKQYLHRLDVGINRMLKKFPLSDIDKRFAAYLLVTYGIEQRADSLYPIYQKMLEEYQIKISVKSIIAEEVGHLEEMNKCLEKFGAIAEDWKIEAQNIENQLFINWNYQLAQDLNSL
jgi:rubrerythrin